MRLLEFGLKHKKDGNLFFRGAASIILLIFKWWADKEEQKLRENGADLTGSERDLEKMLQYIKQRNGK